MISQANPSFKVKKGDKVQVIAGKEKGKSGTVKIVDRESGRVKVDGLNMVKRHLKPSQQKPQGGIELREGWLSVSNVLLSCPKCSRGVRVGFKVDGKSSKKIRICKKCDGEI